MKHSKIKYCIVLINVLLISPELVAQKEGNIWYFGNKAGLDFNSGTPVALLNGTLSTREGCSAISDNVGNLLFYTDGDTVWNANHIPMPNGFGLMGHPSSTQTALIVQKPNSMNDYYIFTTPSQVSEDGNWGFRYSIVDMTLDGGLGDIANKNVLLHDSVTEKLTAVRHANGCDVWVITHEWDSDRFLVYLVDESSINPAPVISNIGVIYTGASNRAIGQLKASPDGSKLALAVTNINQFQLFDFDNVTGLVSNPVTFTPPSFSGEYSYGVEFSPDGTKLYGSTGQLPGIYQWNLLAGSSTDIINSETLIGGSDPNSFMGALQLGPDGKI